MPSAECVGGGGIEREIALYFPGGCLGFDIQIHFNSNNEKFYCYHNYPN